MENISNVKTCLVLGIPAITSLLKKNTNSFLEAQNILSVHKAVTAHLAQKQSLSSNERQSLTELRADSDLRHSRGVMGKPTRLSRGLIPIHQNQSREVKSMLLKCMIMKSLKLEN